MQLPAPIARLTGCGAACRDRPLTTFRRTTPVRHLDLFAPLVRRVLLSTASALLLPACALAQTPADASLPLGLFAYDHSVPLDLRDSVIGS